jgi:AraC-like DNA-binding protein
MNPPYEYIEYQPAESLKKYIKHFYLFNSQALTPERILPLGTIEMTISLGSTTKDILINNTGTRSYFVTPKALNETVGICFQPWGLHGLFQLSPAELAQRKLPLRDILRPPYRDLVHQVQDQNTPAKTISVLQKFLLRLAQNQESGVIDDAVKYIDHHHGQLHLPDLYHRYYVSQRRLQQLFECAVGMPPKKYSRLKRFQFAVTQLKKGSSLTTLALNTGYYDQPHFIHEFSQFAGVSPMALLKESNKLNAINARSWFEQ